MPASWRIFHQHWIKSPLSIFTPVLHPIHPDICKDGLQCREWQRGSEQSRAEYTLWRHGGAGPGRAHPRLTMGVTKPLTRNHRDKYLIKMPRKRRIFQTYYYFWSRCTDGDNKRPRPWSDTAMEPWFNCQFWKIYYVVKLTDSWSWHFLNSMLFKMNPATLNWLLGFNNKDSRT